MNYRIYQNITGWEYITTTNEKNLNRIVRSIAPETYILIIKHNITEDYDEPYYHGFATDYEQKVKKKVIK